MKVAFTLCSANYLPLAKTLGRSLLEHNPDYRFVVGLVDRWDDISGFLAETGIEILDVEKVQIPKFASMVDAYSLVELITSVKPFYFNHLFNQEADVELVAYFDPDVLIYSPLKELENTLLQYDIVLTPHLTEPITDGFIPTEKHIFETGVFNLGFLALANRPEALKLIAWWSRKLETECWLDLSRGYFVDQLWMNIAPCLFDNVRIEKRPGYNAAHWNLHERMFSNENGHFLVNGLPLIFFHFSHFDPLKENQIAKWHSRYNLGSRPDLRELFESYRRKLLDAEYQKFKAIRCYFLREQTSKVLRKRFAAFLRKNVPLPLKIKFGKYFHRLTR